MLECNISEAHGIATVMVCNPRFGFSRGETLEEGFNALVRMAPKGIIFDASNMRKMSQGMLGGVVDIVLRLERARAFHPFAFALALCGLPAKTMEQANALGLGRIVPIFDDAKTALSDPRFKSIQLQGFKSIVLCAKQGARLAPMTSDTPAALLELLGRPVLEHVLQHANKFGLRDFIINPGFGERQIQRFAQTQTSSIFCVNESAWQRHQTNDVATLVRLHTAHGSFTQDTFVFQSSVLSDLDLVDMMQFHKTKDADVTIAVGNELFSSASEEFESRAEQNASAILLSPRAAEALVRQSHISRNTAIVPTLKAAGLDVHLFVSNHSVANIKCGADYYACQAAVLKSGAFGIKPNAERVGTDLWVSHTGDLSPKAEVLGPCFIGAGATVSRGSVIKGCSVIGSDSEVQRNTIVSNSILMPQTRVSVGGVVDHMITSGHWSVNHRFADGSLQNRAVLDGISSSHEREKSIYDIAPKAVKIA